MRTMGFHLNYIWFS